IHYRNLGPTTWNVTRRFEIHNNSNHDIYAFSGAAENIFPYSEVSFTRNYLYNFDSEWTDSASFTFVTYLITDINPETSHFRWNDTLRYEQQFNNYYAYDDGTAENGYGLYGEGTQNGRVAVKYVNYQSDWLAGIYMYFNRTYNDANQKYFRLAVWDDNNGKPGNIIYEQIGERPEFTDSLNRFSLYRLDEELWIEPGVFYIGWIQTTTDMLNVGFDFNRVNNSKLFYNTQGVWENSQFKGSLMIRPVFGELTEPPTSTQILSSDKGFILYPNPTNNSFSINFEKENRDVTIRVFSITGQQLLALTYQNNPIDVSSLPAGTYLVQMAVDKMIFGTQKLIIVR
ncbi:MAG: hypothetical protein CVT98_07450, partial [Bacteroidetes bacterium HGW-Bacteroidetes-15]